MNFCFLHKKILALCLCCLLLASCMHSDYDCPITPNGSDTSVYLSLQINTGNDNTRANPNGGEDGDGTENGFKNENKIEKLAMLFFEAKDITGVDDMNNPKNITIYKEYCDNPIIINQIDGATDWTTRPIELKTLNPNEEYYMVVVANAYKFDIDKIGTLEDLQDFVFTGNHWQEADKVANNSGFVMTSRFKSTTDMTAAKVTLNYNTYDDPAEASASLERLAARVDIIPTTDTNGAKWDSRGYYKFPVRPTSGTSKDSVYLYGIELINKYNQGSYLLKHIAEATSTNRYIDYDKIKRIGREEPLSGIQQNYVVDPNTENKTGEKYPTWYSNYYSNFSDWKPVKEVGINDFYVLDYTQENTMSREFYLERHYITALNLACVYVPEGFTLGATFYGYKENRYKTLQDVVQAVNNDAQAVIVDEFTVLQRDDVTTYEDGKCYYTYYIRHSEDDSIDGIMKYGIVRNNIYRITINSFKGMGSDEKNDPIPITKNVEFTIWVKPWIVIENDEIIL